MKSRHAQEGQLLAHAYAHVVGDVAVRGNLVPDAHVVTIFFQHGVRTLYNGMVGRSLIVAAVALAVAV
jgi:hypothetical protein